MKLTPRTEHFSKYVSRLEGFCKAQAWLDTLEAVHSDPDVIWQLFCRAAENQDVLISRELDFVERDEPVTAEEVNDIRSSLAVSVAYLLEMDRVLEAQERELNERSSAVGGEL